ncbi:MAG TPA: ATP-binding cassette domain-containing protein, partial [bacterium]|nr:ATP-binding cassette domain-containing protein [bacterium]
QGEVLAVIGPSGSGKSTLLRCITHLETVSGGTVSIGGEYMVHNGVYAPASVLRSICLNVGLVFQNFNLFPHFSVLRNITEAQIHVLRRSKKDAERRAHDLLAKMGLSDKESAYPFELSGGQQQRVSIARALVRRARILILDDVTSSLDMETEHYVQRAIEKHYGDFTKIIIAHRVSAVKNADEIIILENGEIVERGTHQELLALRGRYFDIYQEQYGKYILDFEEEMV